MAKKKQHTRNPRSPKALSAVTRAFVENRAFLHVFLRRVLRRQQDIEDIAQEAYLKAYSVEQQREIDHPKAFLFTIAKNIAISELTKKAQQVTDYIEECTTLPVMASSSTVENEMEARESLGLYCQAVASLPEQCRRVYLLRRVHGLRQKEIAESLGISLRAVEKHLQKGALKCRAFIDEGRNEKQESKASAAGCVSVLPREDMEK
jgi:RNA polymerase sigma factor (sigma-70 family)